MKEVKLILGIAGFCFAHEVFAIRGGRLKSIKFKALFGLINHPEHGYILFDTGYTDRFYTSTKRFPNKIYALATKVVVKPEDELKHQLQEIGIKADEIKHIIISHFHADHIGGLKDFPSAKFHCSKTAFQQLRSLSGFSAVSKGLLHDLLPDDFDNRVAFLEDEGKLISDKIFGELIDLFGDNSLLMYPVPGHAAGQYALRLQTIKSQYFLISDACWLKESYQNYKLPNPIVRLFFDSWRNFKDSLLKVHNFHKANSDIIIVPTHCSETTDELVGETLDWDAL